MSKNKWALLKKYFSAVHLWNQADAAFHNVSFETTLTKNAMHLYAMKVLIDILDIVIHMLNNRQIITNTRKIFDSFVK